MKACQHLAGLSIAVGAIFILSRCGVGPISLRSPDQAPPPTTPNKGGAEQTGGTPSTNKDREKLSLSLFEEHLMPTFPEAGCANCHATTQAPLFAQPDVAKAHHAVQAKVDLEEPRRARIVERQLDESPPHNCGNSCDANASKFLTAITAWKKGLDAACAKQQNLCADYKTSSENTGNNMDNNTGNNTSNNTGNMNTAKQTQFNQTISSIIQTNCGSCHAGKYDASSFTSVWTNRAAIARHIQGVGSIMPPSGNWAATGQKQQVLDWLQN